MGGKLDATNILNNQVVSVISKIARDHQNFLGNTLEEIALHKAGILRPSVPYIVNPINEWNVHDAIDDYAAEIGAGPRILPETEELRENLYSTKDWHKFATGLRPFQRDNAVLAFLAVLEVLKSMNESTRKSTSLLSGLRNKVFPGRLQRSYVRQVFGASNNRRILIDGAHNPDAAEALNDFVRPPSTSKRNFDGAGSLSRGRPITWVLAMTDGKDARRYLARLLRPGDNVVTTTFGPVDGMPWVRPMDPKELLKIALESIPEITGLYVPTAGTFRALCAAKYLTGLGQDHPIVLTGSLYLVGDFLREKRQLTEDGYTMNINWVDREERNRVNNFLSNKLPDVDRIPADSPVTAVGESREEEEARKLLEEIEKLNREMQFLDLEEKRLTQTRSFQPDHPVPAAPVPLPSTPSPEPNSKATSPKQKFFEEFENIRKQLANLPSTPLPPTESAEPDNNLRDLVKTVPPRPDVEAILKQEEKPRIRAHYARSDPKETPINRTFRLAHSDGELPSKVRRVLLKDQAEVDVRKLQPLKIRKHQAKAEDDEDEEPRSYLRKAYSNAK